jgi:serine/tyrosine/threonine adenylyltransferase
MLVRMARNGLDDVRRRAAMNLINPRYVLRNYLAQQVIDAAERRDYTELDALHLVLERPYDDQPGCERYSAELPGLGAEAAGELLVLRVSSMISGGRCA